MMRSAEEEGHQKRNSGAVDTHQNSEIEQTNRKSVMMICREQPSSIQQVCVCVCVVPAGERREPIGEHKTKHGLHKMKRNERKKTNGNTKVREGRLDRLCNATSSSDTHSPTCIEIRNKKKRRAKKKFRFRSKTNL